MGRRIIAVYIVKKDDPRLAVPPGRINDLLENLPSCQPFDSFARAGVDEFVFPTLLHCLHEFVGERHRDVEVIHLIVIGLGRNERFRIRVIYPQNTHISATPRTTLLDGLGGYVENCHKAEGTT